MPQSLYSWKEALAFRHRTDPTVAGRELERIAELGPLTPAAIVAESRPEGAVLHDEFTWEDAEAGERWRHQEARHLVDHLVVSFVREDRAPLTVRAWQTIAEDHEHRYIRIDVGFTEPAIRAQLLANALRELHNFERRYRELAELAGVFAAAERVREQLAARDAPDDASA